MELMTASRQWASRPDDQRFTSLDALVAHCTHQRQIGTVAIYDPKAHRGLRGLYSTRAGDPIVVSKSGLTGYELNVRPHTRDGQWRLIGESA